MPVLEMALAWVNFYQGLQRCLATESRSVATTPKPQKSRNRRRQKGIGRSLRASRRLREIHLNAGEEIDRSEPQEPNMDNFTVSLTSCQEVSCFPAMPAMSSAFLKKQQLQKRLRERPLILNAVDVLQAQWSHWLHTCWPTLVAASVQVSFGSPRLWHSLMGLYDEEERDPPIMVLAYYLVNHFKKICKRTDTALCSAGPGPIYRTTSAAMELIDIRELLQLINEALVNYLLSISDTEISLWE